MAENQSGRWALALIAGVAVLRFALLAFASPNLSFDEAQYWAWAQKLQLGYYSKPPMVAWAIAATTALFGEGEGAVKLGSAVAHTGTALLIFALGRALYSPRIGAWAGAVWMTMPAVSLSAVMITTDPFLLFFWAGALLCLVRALAAGPGFGRWWLGLGLCLGLGLLSKYAMAFFLGCLALYLVWDKQRHPLWKAPGLWLSVGLGMAIYAPNALWNAANGFVSYAHTKDNANLGGTLFNPAKLLEFAGGQFGVFGPILMAALLVALAAVLRGRLDGRARLLAAFALPILGVMAAEALLSRANANWTAPAFVAASVLVSAYLAERAPRWLAASLALHLAIMGGLYFMEPLRALAHLPDSAKFDPEKRIKAWDQVGARVSAHLAAHPGAVLMGDERKVVATLIYYVRPHPFDAVKWNPDGRVRDHYDQTTRLEPGTAQVIYVTEEESLSPEVARRFDGAALVERIDIPVHADYRRRVDVWLLTGFKGY